MECSDYLVSKEIFSLNKCLDCGFVFTNPRPSPEEITPYYKSENYYSHSDKNRSIVSIIYNFIRKTNIKNKLTLVQKASGTIGTLLDYGCGAGLFVKSANEAGWNARGIEPNADARQVANEKGLTVESPTSISTLKKGSFNVITLWHVLEHLHDINEVIPKLRSLLIDDGVLLIAVPNVDSWDAKHYQEKWAAYDVPRHLYHFSPKTLALFFNKFGMRVVNTYPMKFDAFYVSLLSETKSIFSYPFAFINGLRSNNKALRNGDYSSLIYIIK